MTALLQRIEDESQLPDPVRSSLQSHRSSIDPKENAAGSLPDDEQVRLLSCWIVECYPSSATQSLLSGLEALGWLRGFGEPGDRTHADWVQSVRYSSFKGGSLNLGIIRSEDAGKHNYLARATASLPPGVQYVVGTAIHHLPSVTQVVFRFVFDEPMSRALEEPLRASYSSWAAKTSETRYRFVSPSQQKREAVQKVWRAIHADCCDWVRRNLPGAFAVGLAEGRFPTIDLLMLEEGDPLTPEPRGLFASYCDILGLRRSTDAWTSDDALGLSLFTGGARNLHSEHSILSGTLPQILANDRLKGYSSGGEDALLTWLMYFDYCAAVLALRYLLISYDGRLSTLRDEAAVLDLRQSEGVRTTLTRIQREVVRLEADVQPLCAELERFCKWRNHFHHELFVFSRAVPLADDESPFFEQVRSFLLMAVPRVRELADRTQRFLSSSTSLISAEASADAAATNIKLQRWITGLTVSILLLTLLLAGLEFRSALQRAESESQVPRVQVTVTGGDGRAV